jgi:SAM-dependent methyltransferase
MTLTLADDRPPVPPADLILRVTTSFDRQEIEVERTSFDLAGLEHLRSFERGLAAVGHSLEQFDRLLDFGCGCGRFLRHLGPLSESLEVHGTDIDAEMIAWCEANIPYASFTRAPDEPPLSYPDQHFSLVINHSVFTHLDERHQDLWLSELQRITRPGAILLLTVEGSATWSRTVEASARVGEDTERWRAELESRGILFIPDDHFVGSTHPDFYHSTIHAPWYVFEHWTRFFELAAYIPHGSDSQDLVVLRRRPGGASAPEPIGHREPAQPARSAVTDAMRVRPLERMLGRLARARERHLGIPEPGEATTRELNMLRAGLYEQGKRISVLAAELRREIDALRARDAEHNGDAEHNE